MLALRDLQRQFVAALFDEPAPSLAAQIVSNGVDPADRVAIYRNNLREGFLKALAIGFPVMERLVGEAYFRQLALEFLRAHPSRAGNLHHIGAPFPAFVDERFRDTQYAYLADIAHLEWAHQEVLVAADAPSVPADALRDITSSEYESLRFALHPACRLVSSDFPVVRIWRANQPEGASDEVIDLGSGGDNVLVLRTPECVELHRLPAGEFAVLRAFSRDLPLASAWEAAHSAVATFDLSSSLQRFFRLKLFAGLNPTHAS
jgi:hypothetical protein